MKISKNRKVFICVLIAIVMMLVTVASFANQPPTEMKPILANEPADDDWPLDGDDPDDGGNGNNNCNHLSGSYTSLGKSKHEWRCNSCGLTRVMAHSGKVYGVDPNRYRLCPCGETISIPCSHGKIQYTITSDKHTGKCKACGKTMRKGLHHWVTKDKDSSKHVRKCTICDFETSEAHTYKWIKDHQQHTKKCTGCSRVAIKENHNLSHNSSTHKSSCSTCGYSYQALTTLVNYNQSQHAKKCNDCNKILEKSNHNFIKTKPVGHDGGGYVYRCLPCGASHIGP